VADTTQDVFGIAAAALGVLNQVILTINRGRSAAAA
jgi:hypothetical protein